MDSGDNPRAEPLLRRALETRRRRLGDRHLDYASSLNDLAVLLVATDRVTEGFSLLREAAAIDDHLIGQISAIASETQRMGFLARLRGARNALLSCIVQYLPEDPYAIQVGLDLVLRRKALSAEALAVQRDALLNRRYAGLAPRLKELQALRSRIATGTLGGTGAEGPTVHQRTLESWLAEQHRLEAELARQIPEMSLEQQLRSVDREQLAAQLPDGAALVEFVLLTPLRFNAVPSRGDDRWESARYLAFVVMSGAPANVRMIDLGEADRIEKLIADYRTSITGSSEEDGARSLGRSRDTLEDEVVTRAPADLRRAVARYADRMMDRPSSADTALRDVVEYAAEEPACSSSHVGVELRSAVFDPVVAVLDGRTRIFVGPDGELNRLPFETLPLDQNRHLIDVYTCSYLSTGRDILRFTRQWTNAIPAPALVAADADFSLATDAEQSAPAPFRRLPGSRHEGQQIADKLGVTPILDGAVLEVQFKTCHSPPILHLATHGFFLPDPRQPGRTARDTVLAQGRGSGLERLAERRITNPLLRSGLALAGANTWLSGGSTPPEAEDGLLMAEDVTGLDLLDTELVVLSACDSGLGDIRAGEGVYGLRRAFVLAGAKTLVMSLWKVPDRATQELMVDFYERLLRGEGRAEALRQAQLKLRKRYPHPRNWGGFICQGDPGPLPAQVLEEVRRRKEGDR